MAKPTIYLDYNATTPLDPGVREVMLPFLGDIFGNPSSIHHVGQRSRACLDAAREDVARVWGCKPAEVVFTSGATESNNLAILGVARRSRDRGRHIITAGIEHDSVLRPCQYLAEREGFHVTYLPVDRFGRVEPEQVSKALRSDTVLVSVQAANNELGTVQAVSAIGRLCQERGVCFHTDAVQWLGKEPFTHIGQFNADLVSVCGHKLYGPKGIGALFVRTGVLADPILMGGPHEHERRAGTENLPGIIGLARTMTSFVHTSVFDAPTLRPLVAALRDAVAGISDVEVHTPSTGGLCNTVAFTVGGADSLSLLAALDLEGICASGGSACSAGSLKPSHVLLAIGLPPDRANALVRFSIGRETTPSMLATVAQALPPIIRRLRQG